MITPPGIKHKSLYRVNLLDYLIHVAMNRTDVRVSPELALWCRISLSRGVDKYFPPSQALSSRFHYSGINLG